MGQKTLDGGCEHVEEMRVGWKVLLWVTMGVEKMEGGKVLLVHDLGGLGKCGVGVPHSHEGLWVSTGN